MVKLIIRKRSLPEWLTGILFILPFLLQFPGLPNFLKYVMDLAWFLILTMTLIRSRLCITKQLATFLKLIGLYLLYTFVVYLFQYQSIIYYLWGLRNNLRYYVAFAAFAIYLRERDTASFLKLMDLLFWLNAAVTFVQFFFLGYQQDYLGGIFGVERGCNGYSIVFFGITVSKSLLSYMNGQEKTLPCFLKSGISLVIAAMAELKIYFVLFPIILFFATLLTRFSLRKFWMLLVASVLLMFGSSTLVAIFDSGQQLSIARIIELVTSTNYATAEDLGRFTAIPTISRTILTDLPGQLFGMGLGNCETSSFAICNTPFYRAHAHLHYTWFSSAFLFLETGYLGLGLNLSFFFISFFSAHRRIRTGNGNLLHCQIAMVTAILCVILTFYNSSLRAEVGYIAYFALALPHIRE